MTTMTSGPSRLSKSLKIMTFTETHRREGEWLYRGEIETKLGAREAAEHIDMGKYEEGEDEQAPRCIARSGKLISRRRRTLILSTSTALKN